MKKYGHHYDSGTFVFCQLSLRATRQFQVTTQEAVATATITVNRNINGPQLRPNAQYSQTINEDAFIGTSVIQIDAFDADNVCGQYTHNMLLNLKFFWV